MDSTEAPRPISSPPPRAAGPSVSFRRVAVESPPKSTWMRLSHRTSAPAASPSPRAGRAPAWLRRPRSQAPAPADPARFLPPGCCWIVARVVHADEAEPLRARAGRVPKPRAGLRASSRRVDVGPGASSRRVVAGSPPESTPMRRTGWWCCGCPILLRTDASLQDGSATALSSLRSRYLFKLYLLFFDAC